MPETDIPTRIFLSPKLPKPPRIPTAQLCSTRAFSAVALFQRRRWQSQSMEASCPYQYADNMVSGVSARCGVGDLYAQALPLPGRRLSHSLEGKAGLSLAAVCTLAGEARLLSCLMCKRRGTLEKLPVQARVFGCEHPKKVRPMIVQWEYGLSGHEAGPFGASFCTSRPLPDRSCRAGTLYGTGEHRVPHMFVSPAKTS